MNIKVVLFFLLFALHSLKSEAKTFNELYDIINNSTSLEKHDLIKLKQKELIEAVLHGNYSHILHVAYLKYELNHRFKKINTEYEIKQLFHLMQMSKHIDHQMYFRIGLNYSSYLDDKLKRNKVHLSLNSYVKKYNLKENYLDIYKELAGNYYQMSKLDSALIYWNRVIQYIKPTDFLQKSSILNNLACVYYDLKDIKNAKKYNILAVNELEKIKNRNDSENDFYYILIGNLGSIYRIDGDYVNARKYFKLNYDYYINSKEPNLSAIVAANELMLLDNLFDTKNDYNIQDIENQYSKIKNNNVKIEFLIFLITYYKKIMNYVKISSYQEKLFQLNNLETKKIINNLNLVNDQLTQEKINEVKAKNASLLEIQKSKAFINYLIICFVMVVSVLLIFFKIKNLSRETKIIMQAKDLELAKKEALENELKYQKESNINLQLNLEIKKKSEVIFMDKLKEIRRKKNNDPEELIKELQLQIMNMLQIDNKNASKGKVKSKEESEFKTILKGLNKNLSEQEIRLCAYFKMNLSNKEISQLEQHLAVTSIRVLKNRIKKKLELGADVKLNDYLNGLC
jgi:hypothetical protein